MDKQGNSRISIYVALILLAIFRTTIISTISLKINFEMFKQGQNRSIEDVYIQIQLYQGIVYVLFIIFTIYLLYELVKRSPDPMLLNLRDRNFPIKIALYALIYLLGYMSFFVYLTLRWQTTSKTAAINSYVKIINLNGTINLGHFGPIVGSSKLLYLLGNLIYGLFNSFIPILTILFANQIYFNSQSHAKPELFPTNKNKGV